jgi:23S rRNA (cytosine1962-C5)-methyltransferase
LKKQVKLKKNEERRLLKGHLWVFSNEIEEITGSPENGEIVDIYDYRSNLLGYGFYNKNSLIAVRVFGSEAFDELKEVFRRRIVKSYELRKLVYPDKTAYRLVFSESDMIPGLIIDRYNDSYVLQVYSYGIEKNIDLVVEVLSEEFSAKNIFSRNEPYFRNLEGLSTEDTVYKGVVEEEVINDGRITYKIDLSKGQKTGFYFDQNDNRFFIEKISAGKEVMDGFCNSGGFGLHAMAAGAEKVTFVDSSADALNRVKENAELNDFKGSYSTDDKDVFDFLEERRDKNLLFDVVMIDPPAFAKNKKNLAAAKKGYKRLNKLAINCIRDEGFLVTSSCSFHIGEGDFLQIIADAAEEAGVRIQEIYFNNASLDHPKIPAMKETSYLKFGVFKVFKK